uniref:(northern house mosquito) hypothetical protein n=1 Tax=Culex pipiens TaxID=7175 RepID=A0A8D8JX31_CULPI
MRTKIRSSLSWRKRLSPRHSHRRSATTQRLYLRREAETKTPTTSCRCCCSMRSKARTVPRPTPSRGWPTRAIRATIAATTRKRSTIPRCPRWKSWTRTRTGTMCRR